MTEKQYNKIINEVKNSDKLKNMPPERLATEADIIRYGNKSQKEFWKRRK